MGIAASMEEMQTKMMVNQRAMQIEMAMKQRQAGIAMQQAVGKERFKYYSAFVGLAYFFVPIAVLKTHKPAMLVPLAPLTIGWLFQYDMFYGNLMLRAQREAARSIREEPERYFLPPGTGIVE